MREPTVPEIQEQLQRILAYPVMNNSLLLSGFLRFIIEETLAGRASSIKEYTIGVNVLSKSSGYDPQADASVRIHAGRLRRALYNYYNGPGAHDRILITVPKGSYVPHFELVEVPPSSPVVSDTATLAKPSVAVIPFNYSDDKSLSSLADGLCDQISSQLTDFTEIAVVSYYSARKILSRVGDIKEAALLLDAKFFLTGNIRASDKAVRVNVQLVHAATQHQIWACSYERELSTLNAFEIEDDIVRHVVNQIAGSHGAISREHVKIHSRQVVDYKVYDAVYWYYHLVGNLNEEMFRKAVSAMRESVKLDSHYALGWAILGETYVAGYFNGFDCGGVDALDEAVKCATHALHLDVRCHHAYQALGLAFLFQRKQKECIQIADQWLRLKSNVAGVAGGLGFCLICAGEYERGYAMLHDSIQLSPYYPWWFNAGFSIYAFSRGEYDDAVYWADKIKSISPLWESILKAAAYSEAGKPSEAAQFVTKVNTFLNAEVLPVVIKSFIQPENLTARILAAISNPRP